MSGRASAAERVRGPAAYRTAIVTALVAEVFVLVALGMLVNARLRRPPAPFDDPQVQRLKAHVAAHRTDAAAIARLRDRDLRLRRDYLRERAFVDRGRALLLAGGVVWLLSIRAALWASRRGPMPGRAPADERAFLRHSRLAQDTLIVAAAALLGGGLWYGLAYPARPLAAAPPERPDVQPEPSPDGGQAEYPTSDQLAQNWPRFRGADGSGVVPYTNLPTFWDGATGTGVLWRTALPLPGHSSPVLWNERVFVTGADRDRRAVFCLDRATGALLWQQAVGAATRGVAPEVLSDTGYAAPTPATDGRAIYAMFATGDIAAFDAGGRPRWERALGVPASAYGYATSLVLYRNLVLVVFDQGSTDEGRSQLMALDTATGATVWTVPRPVPNSWATPIVVATAAGDQLVTSANPWVIAYDLATGRERWRAECLGGEVAPSPVYGGGRVYAVNAYAALAAIGVDGQGDVSRSHVAWKAEDNLPDICSPLVTAGLVFLLTTQGTLTCFDAQTGAKLWEQELGGTFQASPSAAGGELYLLSEAGEMVVAAAERRYREIRRLRLGEGGCRASPAFADGRIVVRSEKHLWCLGAR